MPSLGGGSDILHRVILEFEVLFSLPFLNYLLKRDLANAFFGLWQLDFSIKSKDLNGRLPIIAGIDVYD